MEQSAEHYFRNVMNGSQRDFSASALRGALAVIEPFYSGVAACRNILYNAGIKRAHRLNGKVISIGNLTAGGTGKTPMVRWLAGRLRDSERAVAVLSRGYKSTPGQLGDEQIMLDRMLNAPGRPCVEIRANPDRLQSAHALAREGIKPDVFVLDDGFQHRRIARDLDIVLLSATDPFGLGHVLPRGLLRESPCGLRRADAVVITHADQVEPAVITSIEHQVHRFNGSVPIYRAVHAPSGMRTQGAGSVNPPDKSLDDLRGKRYFAFCGIGNPESFDRQLGAMFGECVGRHWFADHHPYVAADLLRLYDEAIRSGADLFLTTEKDWVKLAPLLPANPMQLEIWRVDVEMRFLDEREGQLWDQICKTCQSAPTLYT